MSIFVNMMNVLCVYVVNAVHVFNVMFMGVFTLFLP